MKGADKWGRCYGRGSVMEDRNETYIEHIARIHGEKQDLKKRIGTQKHYVKQKKVAAYMEATHKYILKHGDVRLKTVTEMTGQEAFDRNLELEKKYWTALDKNPKARLFRWVLEEGYER